MRKFSDLTETDEKGLPVLMAAWHDLWDHDDARRVVTLRKPARCHKVSGRMIVRTFRIDGNQRYSRTRNQRSQFASWTRPRNLRRKIINRCRSAIFSAASRIFDLNGEAQMTRTNTTA